MSDEGLMTDGIEDGVVLKALKKCALLADEVMAWCSAMHAHDRVRFIAQKELEALGYHFQSTISTNPS